MGRAVCRKCWTWHGSGATVCPRCGAPLQSGATPLPEPVAAPAGPVAPQPVAPSATTVPAITGPAGSSRHAGWFAAIAAAVVVLGVVASVLVLHWSAKAVSADGAFTVQVPSGWERFTATPLPEGTATTSELMALRGPISDGVQAHLVVTVGLDHETCGLALSAPHVTGTTRTTVAGSAALVTDCRTSTVSAELITVNHGSRTYTIAFTCASSQFAQLRDGALHDLLASWRWN